VKKATYKQTTHGTYQNHSELNLLHSSAHKNDFYQKWSKLVAFVETGSYAKHTG
jgi:hypothetical protein